MSQSSIARATPLALTIDSLRQPVVHRTIRYRLQQFGQLCFPRYVEPGIVA